MKKYLPFLLFGGAIAVYFLSKANAAKKLSVYFKDLSFGKATGFRIPDLFARFRIVNPTNTPLTIDSIAGDIYFNKSLLASVQNLSKVVIPANSEIIYPIKIEASAFGIAQTVYNYIRNRDRITVSFDGNVNSTGIVMPLKQVIVQE